MISAAYTAAETQRLLTLFNGLNNTENCHWPWGSRPPSNTCRFLGRTWVSLPYGISIGSAVIAQYIRVTNTQTDTQTSLRAIFVAIGHVLCIESMRCGLIIAGKPKTGPFEDDSYSSKTSSTALSERHVKTLSKQVSKNIHSQCNKSIGH